MTDYYALLKVSRNASGPEIRQAYRRMAILLHPDKNPHPEAADGFRAITEAWEVLGDPFKKALYDQMLHEEANEVELRPHRDPAYRRRTYVYTPRDQSNDLSVVWRKYTMYVVWFANIFSALLLMDYLLPEKKISDEIIRDQRTLHHHILYTEQGHSFNALFPQNKAFHKEPEITVHLSPILGFLKGIETSSGNFKLANLPSLYLNFAFAPFILVLLSVSSLLFMKKNGEAQFNAAIGLIVLMLLNLVFFVWSKW